MTLLFDTLENMDEQVEDDIGLLRKMMEDMGRADELYKPTNYWAHYQQKFLPELTRFGLRDFRSRKGSVLSSFIATDNLIGARLRLRTAFRGSTRISEVMTRLFTKLKFIDLEITEVSPEEITLYFYSYVNEKFKNEKFDLSLCPATPVGNPEDRQIIDGALWSTAHLQHCSFFIDAARRIAFQDDFTICELGTGLGRSIEVMARLFKNATFFSFDIPPQLYVCNQYLKKIFGDRVIPYEEGLAVMPSPDGSIPPSIRGKIVIQPSWRMPDWSKTKMDVFWNNASFQEMEPPIVLNYLDLVVGMNPAWIYINARPDGEYWGEWKPGRGGTKQPVLEKHYLTLLDKGYLLEEDYPSDYFMRRKFYKTWIFKRKGKP